MPPAQGNHRPYSLDEPERPRPLQEAVDGGQHAGERKKEHIDGRTLFQRIAGEHHGNCEQAEKCQAIHVVSRSLFTAAASLLLEFCLKQASLGGL